MPLIHVLGTAQDAGLPQIGCACDHCRRARREPAFRRPAACFAVVNPTRGTQYLIDATPDLREQVDCLLATGLPGRTAKRPVDGVLLTHAHIGHYTGLMQFGREAASTRELPVHCTPAMEAFLTANAPWSQLVGLGNIALVPTLADNVPFNLDPDVTVTPLLVPHRNEFADTVGFRLTGPQRSLLYIPDIDRWTAWARDLAAEVAAVDVALLDGTFFAATELGDRPQAEVPHPPVRETMDLLQALTARTRIGFIHLNHSNPLVDPASPAARELTARGFFVAAEGDRYPI